MYLFSYWDKDLVQCTAESLPPSSGLQAYSRVSVPVASFMIALKIRHGSTAFIARKPDEMATAVFNGMIPADCTWTWRGSWLLAAEEGTEGRGLGAKEFKPKGSTYPPPMGAAPLE
jgi:hypothetical protein